MKKIILGLSLAVSLFASVESEVEDQRFEYKNNILIDHITGIKWLDEKHKEIKGWSNAKKYCNRKTYNGIRHWRLPTIDESISALSFFKQFKNLSGTYWTSSLSGYSRFPIFIIEFPHHLNALRAPKSYSEKIICVKSANKINNFNIYLKSNLNKALLNKDQTLFNNVKKENTVKAYQKFLKNYFDSKYLQEVNKAINKIYKTEYKRSQQKDTINAYKSFIKKYPKALQAKKAQQKIYELAYNKANNTNSIKAYSIFIKNYKYAPQKKKAQKKIYNLAYSNAKNINNIQSYVKFINSYRNAPQKQNAIQNIYNLTKKENNISDYEWFISKYPNTSQVKDAIKNIHKLAYNKAKEINTISAYNTFVYAYPFATQVRDANDKAYEMEAKKYTDIGLLGGFFQKEAKMEKKARKLLIKAKQIERTAQDYNGNAKVGYIIVANRMYQLLQEKFDDSEATLNYMNSLEFKDFTNSFKKAMKDIKYILNQINSNTSDISRYAQESINISKQGFEDAKADRAMSRYKNEEHTKWEKQMHLREKGYN